MAELIHGGFPMAGVARSNSWLTRLARWALVGVVVLYGGFSLSMGASELEFVLGRGPEVKHRATPIVFVVHAFAGAIALFAAPLLSVKRVRQSRRLRPILGRTYVISVFAASVTAAIDANSFSVTLPAKAVFLTTAVLWFATTAKGAWLAHRRRRQLQHEWMVRSYALSLFVVSFSLWVPALAETPLPPSVSYPLALAISTTLNLSIAELWIRRNRGARLHATPLRVAAV
jgi:hypothetical protein